MTTYSLGQHDLEFDRALSDLEIAHGRIEQAVYMARRDGHSWEQIGAWLGVTKQAAHKRYAQVREWQGDGLPRAHPVLEGQSRLL